jgi:hypothetical protein
MAIGDVEDAKKMETNGINKEIALEVGSDNIDDYSTPMPYDKLEFQAQLINPTYGIPSEYSQHAKDNMKVPDENGEIENLLANMNIIFKRDVRFGFLKRLHNEVNYVQEFIDFGSDLLSWKLKRSAATCITRAATVLEVSQSENGNLRKELNTFTKKSSTEIKEAKDNSLWGGSKDERSAE